MHIFHRIVEGERQRVPGGKHIYIVLFRCTAGLIAAAVCADEQHELSRMYISLTGTLPWVA